jgi:hemoglobin-like flavoprotein
MHTYRFFIWDYMTVSMNQTLEAVSSTFTLVKDSWDYIMETHTADFVGAEVYQHLFALVPNVASIFTKPKNEMSIKMGNMLEMIVSCASDPDNMKQQLMWLGLRHVNFKILPRHIPLMGPVLMAVLSEVCGVYWNSALEKAWYICIYIYTYMHT